MQSESVKTREIEIQITQKLFSVDTQLSLDNIALPQASSIVSKKILELADDPFVNVTLLKKIILWDPALCLRLLKNANTFSFSGSRQVASINKSMMILGWKNVRGIIASASITSARDGDDKTDIFFLHNTMLRTIFCAKISNFLKTNLEEKVCSISLILEIGRLAMIENSPQKYQEVLEQVENNFSYKEAEQTTYEFISTKLSMLLSKKWNLADSITQTIDLLANGLPQGVSEKQEIKVNIVSLSELLALEQSHKDSRFKSAVKNLSEKLNITEDALEELKNLSRAEFDESLRLLRGY